MTAEERLNGKGLTTSDSFVRFFQDDTLEAMQEHTISALTAYRAEVLSAIEKGEDILKIDIEKFNK